MCRNDADCPSLARCLEYPTPALAERAQAMIGMCTPESKIAGTVCLREAACPAGQGCVLYGARTSAADLPRRRPEVAGRRVHRGQRVPQRRMLRPRLPRGGRPEPHPLLGAVPGEQRLRSRPELRPPGGRQQRHGRRPARRLGRRLLPHAVRARSTACSCTNASSASARQNGSDTCDTAHGLCYRKAAAPGSPCTDAGTTARWAPSAARVRASSAAIARPSGATPSATSGVDACPGTNSACATARRSGRADLGLLREMRSRAGRRAAAPRGLLVRGARRRRGPQHLPGRRAGPRRAARSDRDAGCEHGRVERARRRCAGRAGPPAAPPPAGRHRRVANAAEPAGIARAGRSARRRRRRPSRRARSRGASVGPMPTADETPPASDHDAVVGHVGIEARRFDPGPLPLALRAGLGCPIAAPAPPTARSRWARSRCATGGPATWR